jgi:hypothetical protein
LLAKKPPTSFLEGIVYELGVTLGVSFYENFLKDMIVVDHQHTPDGPRHMGPLEGCRLFAQSNDITTYAFSGPNIPAGPVSRVQEDADRMLDGLYAVHHGDPIPSPVPECLKDILPQQQNEYGFYLPTEDSEEDDHWFLSADRQPANPEMIKSMEKSAEAARAESEMLRAQADLERQRRAQILETWNSPRIDHMVSTYGEIEAFTGLTDLTEEQLKHLKTILNSAPLNAMKKNKRAAELVKKWITPEEWAQLLKEHKVTIKSKKYKNKFYIVKEDPYAQVEVYEKDELKMKICGVTADSSYAEGDQVLNKIISIKEDEDYYIKNSNVSRY